MDSLDNMALGLGISFLLGLLIAFSYARAYRGFYYSASFVHTCVITVLLVDVLVSIVIQTASAQSAALAFSLVGLLGLIRFRTVVRDTREFSYIFLSIVTGVGVGSGNRLFAIGSCLATLAILITFERISFGAAISPSVQLRITGLTNNRSLYQEVLAEVSNQLDLVSIRQKDDGSATYAYDVVTRSSDDLSIAIERLAAVAGTSEVRMHRWKRSGSISEKNED